MKSYLKIKVKSLAEEAKIIRFEERRVHRHWKAAVAHQDQSEAIERIASEALGLRQHRTVDVRKESRSAGLAYAILRGLPYSRVEPAGSSVPNVGRIAELVAKYGYFGKQPAIDTTKTWLGIAA